MPDLISYSQLSHSTTGLLQFKNCQVLRNGRLQKEDFWIENGIIKNPEPVFFAEHRSPNYQIDCGGCIVAPGLIETQINGKCMGNKLLLPLEAGLRHERDTIHSNFASYLIFSS